MISIPKLSDFSFVRSCVTIVIALLINCFSTMFNHSMAAVQDENRLTAIKAAQQLAKQHLVTEEQAQDFLLDFHQRNKMSPSLNTTYLHNSELTAYLLCRAAQNIPAEYTVEIGLARGYDLRTMLDLAYQTTKNKSLLTNNLFFAVRNEHELIQQAAIKYGVNPAYVRQSSKKNHPDYRITPLLESISVSIYNKTTQDIATLEYRKMGADEWLAATALQWNSVDHSLTTSIAYLEEQTEYQLKLTINSATAKQSSQIFTVKTLDSQPQFDPNKVYHLKDIYAGGQLNLEALQITGNSKGWAKIIGDKNTPIIVEEGKFDSAIHIGENSYIYFENIIVKGGRLNAISSKNSHHLWFNGCDISSYGRMPSYTKNGKRYERKGDKWAINYDSAFGLYQTGSVIIENCTVHSPNIAANNWGSGHPLGANAYLAAANHPNRNYQGQVVIRNNRFYGTDEHRFNDVIESHNNGYRSGGFVRDSAIYNNYLAYANDDIIELDGGQNNVLLYDNEIEQGYVGVSIIPNRNGPSYVFNNYIHNLGDDRGKTWAGIKAGGLLSGTEGISYIYNNLLLASNNGIASASFKNDFTYWIHAKNNIMIHNHYGKHNGYSIYDKTPDKRSSFENNYMFNLTTKEPRYHANHIQPFFDSSLQNSEFARQLWNSEKSYVILDIPSGYRINNLTRSNGQHEVIIGRYQNHE